MWAWLLSACSALASATAADWAAVSLCVGVVLYWLGTRNHDHFRRLGFPYESPLPLLGSMASVAFGRTSVMEFNLQVYQKNEGRSAFGMFVFMRPTVVVLDPQLIKVVAVKDFDHFVDRQVLGADNGDIFSSRSVMVLRGQEWRDLRATLSPTFTCSKMRTIFSLIDACGERCVDFLRTKAESSPGGVWEAEMKDFFTRFGNDVIATSSLGVECDSLRQPENEIYRMGREFTSSKGTRGLTFIGYVLTPKLMKFLGIPFVPRKIEGFFHNLVHGTIDDRRKKGIFRPDLLQLLMQAREGTLEAEAGDEQEVGGGTKMKGLCDKDITSQVLTFFFGGFDTVSMAASFCAYALARHPEAQERVQREVDEAFEANGGKLTYEAVTQQMKYLDMFINEVLRLYTSVPALDRLCTKDFTIPAHGDVPAYTVRRGEAVWIPVYPIHRDPKYWEDPEKFDPERFSAENKHKIHPYTYFPFGLGPRACIGYRYALLEMKVALAHILRRFSFRTTPKTPKKVEYIPRDLRGNIKGGFWVGVAPRAQ